MRVKRLEIQGFKSFKDKTVIHFDHEITGIVGPNGCGKSNIVDAFFWVMGEQSYKHMRGSGSEDLIFNGSSKYAPTGMAEATLVLETDAVDVGTSPAGATTQDLPIHLRSKEISVTRRVYRSGEGEYFINGITARLKDIQELFMDTGVGAKGYSVIEQGQIGKIVQAKPEDRRLLIEEAAGIAKYKARKKESLRKMEATQTNLSRLNDVIQEIGRNLDSLERQAQKARLYRKYKDELLDKEMTWGRRKHQVLQQKISDLRSRKDSLEQDLAGLRAELQIAENSIETDRIDQVTDTKLAEEIQSKVQSLSEELAHERSALDLSRQRQGDLSSQLGRLEQERQELLDSVATETERLRSSQTEAAGAEEAFRLAATKAQTQDETVRRVRQETETVRRALEADKRELMAGITQSTTITSKVASLSSRADSAREQAVRLAHQSHLLTEKLSAANEETEKAQSSFQTVASKRETLQTDRKQLAQEVQSKEQQLRLLERAAQESSRELTQSRSRLQSLEELASAYEGISNGPKAALEWAKSSGSKLRPLADALEVKSGLEGAVHGWLENRLESLVSDKTELALEAVAEVSEKKKGRVTIQLPSQLSGAKPPIADKSFAEAKQILESAGFELLGELSNFVTAGKESNSAASAVIANAVANVCVVTSFAPMKAFLASSRPESLGGWSIVSLDGTALDTNGSLRGGSGGKDAATILLERKRAISDLREQCSTAETKNKETESAVAREKESLELAKARLHALQAEIQALEIQGAALERDVHMTGRALRDAESQAGLTLAETQRLHAEAEEALAERANLEAEVTAISSKRTELESRITTGEAELVGHDTKLRAHETDLQSLRVNEASLRERSTSFKRELDTVNAMIRERQRRLAEIDQTLERASRERDQFSGGEGGLSTHIQELTVATGEARRELALVKDRLEQSGAKVNAALARLKELHGAGDAKTAESTNVALEIEKHTSDLNHLIQNLEEKYGPGCLDRPALSPIQEEMSEPVITIEMTAEEEHSLGEEVERIRERIRRLGEVNNMAVEEFEERKKRYDYLLSEKSDLERSIENLQDAIEHINKTSEERFRRAFDAIADRFERLFPIIFGGGQAKLSLVYPEGSNDILDAGVDIHAQPPGKKIVNISLLSGGEKALTAVSLIFAIFMVKPSPFCVLDEVDAPLDDANIGKFNALLREMSVKSQFILITHNKKTMELNDTLYGVTMEEPGVSKMVSIELH